MENLRASLWGKKRLFAGVTLATSFLSFLVVFPKPLRAAPGTEAASFLDIPVGAEPASLGAAYTALANNAYAPVYNPAGLGFAPSNEIAGQHLSYLESINYEFLSFIHPLSHDQACEAGNQAVPDIAPKVCRGSAIGVSAQYLGTGSMVGTDISGKTTGDFSTHFASYNLAYGRTVTDRLSLGITGKMIEAKIDNVGAQAFAGDAGAMYKADQGLTVAAALSNIGTKLKFLQTGGTLPQAIKVGAAYQPNYHWNFTGEGVYSMTGLASAHVGTEWKPIEMIAIRAGYRTDTIKELSALAGLSAGLGVQLWGQELAYAWVPYGDLGSTQYFSALVRFGQQTDAKHNLERADIKLHHSYNNSQYLKNDVEYQDLKALLSDQESELSAHNSPSNPVGTR